MKQKELIMSEFESGAELITTGRNEVMNRAVTILPAYEDITEKRVLDEMKKVFRGFSFSLDDNVEQSFKSVDQLGNFIKIGNEELVRADQNFKQEAIYKSGAIMARRWFFGYVLDRCLKKASYGSGAPEKIAKISGISIPYLYQYKKVGSNLTIKDAYILGIYDAGWELVRMLSTIDDEAYRTTLIKMYIDSIKDFDNVIVKERARGALKAAIEQIKSDNTTIDSSDVKQLIENQNLEVEAPEFWMAKNTLTKLNKVAIKLGKEDWYESMHNIFGDCFLMSDIFNAEGLRDDLKDTAENTIKNLEAAMQFIPDLIVELKSLANMELTQKEE